MKYNLKYIIIILACLIPFWNNSAFSQMPTNGDYSNWDWTDMSSNNWKIKSGTVWVEISPPFLYSTERTGEIVEIYENQDYTPELGWNLLWAQFDGTYPYYVLYNNHRGLLRVFFYTSTTEFSYLGIKLSLYDNQTNPGIFTARNKAAYASDKYLNSTAPQDDFFMSMIHSVGVENWCSADFPMVFDKNIENSIYNNKKYVLQFYGCNNFSIEISETQQAPSGQYTISGNESQTITGSTFNAQFAKYNKSLTSLSSFFTSMVTNANKIPGTDTTTFLVKYKQAVTSFSGIAQFVASIASFSSSVQAVLSFYNLIVGVIDTETTKPVAVEEKMNLNGTMTLSVSCGGTTLKIPGVTGDYNDNLPWDPYDCPLGLITMETTPTISRTETYERYLYPDPTDNIQYGLENGEIKWIVGLDGYPMLMVPPTPIRSSGYAGKYIKYKFDQNITLGYQNIEGLDLIDVHFALVCYPNVNEASNNVYSITDQYISEYGFFDNQFILYIPTLNPLWNQLQSGRLRLYNYDPDDIYNKSNYYGTPLLDMNDLKGYVIEIPEHTDVKLRIVARFTTTTSDVPVIYQNDYILNQPATPEQTTYNAYYCRSEVANFPFLGYFNYLYPSKITLNSSSNTTYQSNQIVLKPGFVGNPGFTALASTMFPTNGNTTINDYSFSCSSTNKSLVYESNLDENDGILLVKNSNISNDVYKVYPNPNEGVFTLELTSQSTNADINIINTLGESVMKYRSNQNINNIDISGLPTGIYFIQITDNNNYSETLKIIKK